MMDNLPACRVCLTTSANLYDMYKYRLKNLFELLSGIQVSPTDNYPQYLCSYCGSLLLTCAAFRDRCRHANNLMKQAEKQCELVHYGERPYKCSNCEKTFSQSNSMKIHVKNVHLKHPCRNAKALSVR